MKILFVANSYYAKGNGLAASARRTVEYLRAAGEDVRVLSGENCEEGGPQPDFILKNAYIPIFNGLVRSEGYQFARTQTAVIKKAVAWADVVHLEEAFFLELVTARICKKMGKPCTGTYHLHPENIFSPVYLGHSKLINHTLLRHWRSNVYNYCSDIQCPSENVKQRLEKFGFKSRLHVISNGVIPDENIRPKLDADAAENDPTKPFLVVCIGRLAAEKDQPTLLKAMRYSRYADRIQLYFAGQGPQAASFKKKAHRLYKEGIVHYEPIFRFHTREELRELAAKADLYIHCATIEVEGLSALEALQQAVTPIFADGDLTATAQFALDERSVFPAKDPRALAARIDYWLDHPEERAKMGPLYAESTEQYDIHKSIEALIAMFELARKDKETPQTQA